jgi:hypothetical protein
MNTQRKERVLHKKSLSRDEKKRQKKRGPRRGRVRRINTSWELPQHRSVYRCLLVLFLYIGDGYRCRVTYMFKRQEKKKNMRAHASQLSALNKGLAYFNSSSVSGTAAYVEGVFLCFLSASDAHLPSLAYILFVFIPLTVLPAIGDSCCQEEEKKEVERF